MDYFGSVEGFAPEACYKKFSYTNPGVRRQLLVQLPERCINSQQEAEKFLIALKKTCVTKLITYGTVHGPEYNIPKAISDAGWRQSDVMYQLGLDNIYDINVYQRQGPLHYAKRYECGLVYDPINKRWYKTKLERPKGDWESIINGSDKASIDRIMLYVEQMALMENFVRKDQVIALATGMFVGASWIEVTACMEKLLEQHAKGFGHNMDRSPEQFYGYLIDEPQKLDVGTYELSIVYQALKKLRDAKNPLFQDFSTHQNTILVISNYTVYDDYAKVCDSIYNNQYGGQQDNWGELKEEGVPLRGGFIDITLDYVIPYGTSDQRHGPGQRHIRDIVDTALRHGLTDIALFAMTDGSWNRLEALRKRNYPDKTLCELYVMYIKEICFILQEKNWFTQAPGTVSYSYQYCTFYPECWKCNKSDLSLWTDEMPVGFPPIDPRSRSVPGGMRTGSDEWWWG